MMQVDAMECQAMSFGTELWLIALILCPDDRSDFLLTAFFCGKEGNQAQSSMVFSYERALVQETTFQLKDGHPVRVKMSAVMGDLIALEEMNGTVQRKHDVLTGQILQDQDTVMQIDAFPSSSSSSSIAPRLPPMMSHRDRAYRFVQLVQEFEKDSPKPTATGWARVQKKLNGTPNGRQLALLAPWLILRFWCSPNKSLSGTWHSSPNCTLTNVPTNMKLKCVLKKVLVTKPKERLLPRAS
mmetsp:Transcript_10919/g.16362  ORF Transcript_10919/g.16362 Transcript_10919/m.16362 type:complete len:241 (+) Transcript_10919:213-935(+)